MTDSLGPQFLPGIDWNPYYPDSINRSNWAENITRTAPPKDTTENANVPLPGMEKVSQFYGDEQKNQQADVLDKLQKNVARHPLP
jgi:hypothetical protein